MARPINTIYKSLEDGLVAVAALAGITIDPRKWSRTDYKRLLMFTVAQEMGIQEQLYDSFVEDTEAVGRILPPQTSEWLQNQMLNVFEYDAVAVPIIQFDTKYFTPYYLTPNPAYRIIKYCSVVSGSLGRVIVKCAEQTSGFPSSMNGTKKAAAQGFVNLIGTPAIYYEVVSYESDKLFMQIDVYYDSLYASVIEARVIAAINNYLATIPFDGSINLTNLEIAIKGVDGVGVKGDVVLINLKARQDTEAFGSGIDLVINSTEISRSYQTFAGYIVPETTASKTLTDFRVGVSGLKNLNLIPL